MPYPVGLNRVVFILISLVLPVVLKCPAADFTANSPGTVLILGDSLAAGHGVDPSDAFPELLQQKIDADSLPFEVVNAGVSGDTSAGGLGRINWLLRRRVDVLVLELGGNDGLRGIQVESTRTNLQEIVERVKARNPRMKLIVAGMRMPENMGTNYVEQFRATFPKLAEANHGVLIPFLLEGVAGDPKLNQADLIHPNAAGHRIVAANVWSYLKPILHELLDRVSPNAKTISNN